MFKKRRENLCKSMKSGIGVFMGNLESPMSYKDNCYNFIQDSTFLYYFGIDRPGIVGVIDFTTGKSYVSGVDFTLEDMIWMGEQKTLLEEGKKYGIDEFVPYKKLQRFLEDKSEGCDENGDDEDYFQEILFIYPYREDVALELSEKLGIDFEELQEYESLKLKKAVISARNIKSKEEVNEIEKAVNVTREMHLKAMEVIKPGIKEYEVVAHIEMMAKLNNCTTSFHTIFSKHGEILHNHNHNNTLEAGDIVVLDCGARTASGYCGDMTTVIPVSGKFTEKQKVIYNILIEMFDCAVQELKPEVEYIEAYKASSRRLIEGMKKLELMIGDTEEILQSGAHALFMPHGLGHMLGMDVHDMENLGENLVGYETGVSRDTRPGYKSLRLSRILKPGFVFTVEPGIYFVPRLIEDYKKKNLFKNYLNYDKIEEFKSFGGMRYEGDFLITETGAIRLGEKMPKTAEEIEGSMTK
ncbi:MAG: aminopeptidase P N-terminal domain-containing protein [Fusobacteriaceae bacterium]